MGNVGTRYLPNVREAQAEAVAYAKRFADVSVVEQPNISMLPFFGLAWMRNRLCMQAFEEGYTHVCLVENDVIMEPRTLMEMVYAAPADCGVMVPSFEFGYDEVCKIQEPVNQRETGWQPIEWSVVSCIMFSIEAFQKISPYPFDNMCIYLEEATHFQKWRLLGAKAYQQTDTYVSLLRKPTPLWEVDFWKNQTPGDIDPAKLAYEMRKK